MSLKNTDSKTICLVAVMPTFHNIESAIDPPTGLLLIGGVLKNKGYDVKLYHIPNKDIPSTLKEIEKLNPLFVGLSTMTSSGLVQTAQMSKHIKDKGITTVWGGVHPSLLPKETLSEDYVDFVVVGEGEETISEFVDELTGSKEFEKVKGLGFKKNGRAIINERRPFIKDIDKYSPDWSLIDINRYIHEEPLWGCKRVIAIQTSRGCPFRCSFCYNRIFNMSIWRPHSAEHVIKYITWLKEVHGVDGLILNEDNFFVNKERGFKILESINIPVWLECHIKFIDDEFASRLAKTKTKSIFIGIESGSPESLKKMNKMITIDETIRAIKIMAKHPKIIINGTMIIGIPGETKKDINMTIDFALKLSKIHPNLALDIGTYVPYPGSEMYQEAIAKGFNPPKNTLGWAKFDIVNGKRIIPTWLPWAGKNTTKEFYVIDKCAIHLNRTPYGNTWQRIAKKVLHLTSYLRLKYKFFKFPVELMVFNLYYRIYIKKKIQKA